MMVNLTLATSVHYYFFSKITRTIQVIRHKPLAEKFTNFSGQFRMKQLCLKISLSTKTTFWEIQSSQFDHKKVLFPELKRRVKL